jgi:hypothetical protein
MPSIIVCKSIGKECEGYQLRHMKKNNLWTFQIFIEYYIRKGKL